MLLIGLDERSATGMGADVGVLQLTGQSVVSLGDLNRVYAATTVGQKLTFGLHRNQQDVTLTITR